MPVSSFTLWDIDPHKGREIAMRARDFAKQAGAMSFRIGQVHTGPQTGWFATGLAFDSWESYGRGQASLANNQQYRALLAEAHQACKSAHRSVLVWEEI